MAAASAESSSAWRHCRNVASSLAPNWSQAFAAGGSPTGEGGGGYHVAMADLQDVRLLQVPLDVHAKTVQWHEDLTREFTLVGISESGEAEVADEGVSVPARLLTLVTELRGNYASFTDPATQALQDARRRGETYTDVTYTVPTAMADEVRRFDELLDEADAFCRTGDLLTLAASPELVSFRRWFLGEFTRQLAGGKPTSWSAWCASAG